MVGFLGGVIAMTIGTIVTVNVLLYTIHNTSTTGWTAGEVALWGTAGLIVVAGLIYSFASLFGLTA
jgi:hypothetical protein